MHPAFPWWRDTFAVLVLGAVLTVTGCGGGPTELVVRGAGPDGCEYEGPSEISAGTVDLLASPSGSGRILAAIYEIDEPFSAGSIDEVDVGAVVVTVQNDEAVNLASRSEELAPGSYAIVCTYGSFNGVIATVDVLP